MFWPVIAATTLAFFAMVGFEIRSTWPRSARTQPVTFQRCCYRSCDYRSHLCSCLDFGDHAGGAGAIGRRRDPPSASGPARRAQFSTLDLRLHHHVPGRMAADVVLLMASRLVYGMSREHVLPPALGKVHKTRRTPYVAIGFTTLLAFALITFVGEVPALGGTTALLLLCVSRW